jgi:hypothetical protein
MATSSGPLPLPRQAAGRAAADIAAATQAPETDPPLGMQFQLITYC